MKILTLIFSMILLTQLGFAQNNSFEGTFLNTELGIRLSILSEGDSFKGEFEVQGQSYPLTGQMLTTNLLSATYPYFGNSIPLQIQKV